MRAFRNTNQLRKEFLQKGITNKSITATNTNTSTQENLNMESNSNITLINSNTNPDIYEEKLFNNRFNPNNYRHQYQHFHSKGLNSSSHFISQAQIDRMKTYIGKLPIYDNNHELDFVRRV